MNVPFLYTYIIIAKILSNNEMGGFLLLILLYILTCMHVLFEVRDINILDVFVSLHKTFCMISTIPYQALCAIGHENMFLYIHLIYLITCCII